MPTMKPRVSSPWTDWVWRFLVLVGVVVAGLSVGRSDTAAHILFNRPDGGTDHLKEGTFQPDLSAFRTKLDAKYLDRRWVTAEAMALANEMFFLGQSGFNDLVRYAAPIAHKAAFHWITHQAAYWYARSNLASTVGAAHMGLDMVQGPYWTLKAIEFADKAKINDRDRGERVPSNKDIMLGYVFPMYWKRLGLPRPLDDTQPAYLMFQSGDPHRTAPAQPADTYYDPQSLKRGKWGVPEYFWNNRGSRWNQDSQVRLIDMGGDAMTMKRGSMWIAYMLKAPHRAPALGSTEEISYLGNDPEEAFRGMALVTTNANRLLAWKAQLVADEAGNLGGINPYDYDPAAGLRYWPHLIWPNMFLIGDLPEWRWAFDIYDPRSLLFDQAAIVLGATEYYHQTYRLKDVFTANPPVDGGLVERDFGPLARGVANMAVKNILAMHTKHGLMVSEWQPQQTKWWVKFRGAGLHYWRNDGRSDLSWMAHPRPGPGDTVDMRSAAYAIKGLFEYVDRMRDPLGNPNNPEHPDVEPALTAKALALLTVQADFLLTVQGAEGAWCEGYHVVTGACVGEPSLSTPVFFGIGAMTAAYHATAREKYMEAARKAWNYVNRTFWHEPTGLFRTRAGDDTVLVTPIAVAAQLWAIREMMFNNPAHLVEPIIDRFPRWMVQTVEMTNLEQAEENRTGELCHGVCSRDFDNDGVPWMGKGHGTYGTAPVFGSAIAVNLGGPNNTAYAALDAEPVDTDQWGGKVVYGYVPQSQEQAVQAVLLPVTLEVQYDQDGLPKPPWVARPKATRFDGVTYPVPPAIPWQRGSSFTGKQIVEMNCAHCHGYSGEGITGIPWTDDSLRFSRDDMFEVPKNGRFNRLMPEWGQGLGDEMGAVLTDDELHRIVDYVQSQEFQRNIYLDFNGYALPGTPPKDVYRFISIAYRLGKQTPATQEDIRLILDAQDQAVREHRPINVVALLKQAEQGRPAESSDPQNLFTWLGRVLTGRNERARVKEPYKVYPTFFDLLAYPARDAQGRPWQFTNVRPVTGLARAGSGNQNEQATEPSQEASLIAPR